MVQPETNGPPFDGNGFIIATIMAPGLALAIFYLGAGPKDLALGPGGVGGLIGSFLMLWLIVSGWGVLPSLTFGGLVLAVIQRMPWRGRPGPLVFMSGGMAAAGLYVLMGLGASGPAPGVALFFAPWATPDFRGPSAGREDWWLVASLLLAGAGAGLIYAAFVKRG